MQRLQAGTKKDTTLKLARNLTNAGKCKSHLFFPVFIFFLVHIARALHLRTNVVLNYPRAPGTLIRL